MKVLRSEFYEALSAIGTIRKRVLFRLVAIDREAEATGGRKIEALLGTETAAMARTVSMLNRESMIDATRALAEIYLSL